MGIKDWFGKRKEPAPPAAPPDVVDQAIALLTAGDAQGAFRVLRPIVAYPALLDDDVKFSRALGALAKVAHALGDPAFGALVTAAGAQPNDVRAVFDAGYQAYDAGLHDVAVTLFLRANRLAPRTASIVAEAAGALEKVLRYDEAAALIDASGLADTDPICAYLSGFCSLMCGDRDRTRHAVTRLAGASDAQIVDMRNRLGSMLGRADAMASAELLQSNALTGWHMALNGTLLLHESPYGHPEPMHGRYAFVGDSPGLMHEGIERLHAVLVDQLPQRIVHAPDRASRILGLAAATRFGRPVLPWSKEVGTPRDALVVAWTLDGVGDADFLKAVHTHAPGQVLFAHGSAWVDPFPFAPDVTTFLYQTVTNPWTGGALVPSANGVAPAPPDNRPDDVLAAEISSASTNDDQDRSVSPLELVLRVRDASREFPEESAAGLFKTHGLRPIQRTGSVVPSARFA